MSKNLGGIFDDDVIVKQMFSWKMVRSYVTAEAFPPIHARSRLLLCTCDTVRALTLRFRPSSICVQAHAEPAFPRSSVPASNRMWWFLCRSPQNFRRPQWYNLYSVKDAGWLQNK